MKIREKIIRLITGYMGSITTAAGYANNFPAAKIMASDIEDPIDEKFCRVFDRGTQFETNPVSRNLIVEIKIGCAVGTNNLTTIYSMTEDVYKCIYTNRYALAGAIGAGAIIEPIDDVPEADRTDKEKMTNVIRFRIPLNKNANWYYDNRDF